MKCSWVSLRSPGELSESRLSAAHPTQRHMMSAGPTVGDANLAYLVEGVISRLFHCKGTFSYL